MVQWGTPIVPQQHLCLSTTSPAASSASALFLEHPPCSSAPLRRCGCTLVPAHPRLPSPSLPLKAHAPNPLVSLSRHLKPICR